jgi:hypothetical protein
MKFKAIKADGKLQINWDRIAVYLTNFKDGTAFNVEIVRRQKTRSTPLRAYYFGAVLPTFMDALGYEKEDTDNFHRQLKIVYFQIKPDKRGIYKEKEIPSVFGDESKIQIDEKQKFIQWVIRKAAENGVYIPDPNESAA